MRRATLERQIKPQAQLITASVQADTHLQTYGEPQNYTWVRPPICWSGSMLLWHIKHHDWLHVLLVPMH